ncbi:MAG: InlB B-repeat-containing protein [Oscillospiraceae bacterium]|nr:InlB B-repeat-containing protein [Oscillospiraceae bacterium]
MKKLTSVFLALLLAAGVLAAVPISANGENTAQSATQLSLKYYYTRSVADQSEEFWFSFTPAVSGFYEFYSNSDTLDPYCELLNTDFESLTRADDDYGLDFYINYWLNAGEQYYFLVIFLDNRSGEIRFDLDLVHEHVLKNWTVSTPSTCVVKGIEGAVCSLCELAFTRDTALKSHTWTKWKTTLAATVSAAGKQERSCTVCNKKETQTIPKVIPSSYTVTFDANGGKIDGKKIQTKSVKRNAKITAPKALPTRKDYRFKGWYTKKSGGTKLGNATAVKNVTYYAQWESLAVKKVSFSQASSASSFALKIGGSRQLSAKIQLKGGKGFNLSDKKSYTYAGKKFTIKWESSKPDIISVKNGKITAKKAGSATITATVGGKKTTLKVTAADKVNSYSFKWIATDGQTRTAKGVYPMSASVVKKNRAVKRKWDDYKTGFSRYLTKSACKEVNFFVKDVSGRLRKQGYSEEDILLWFVAFVQNFDYQSDKKTKGVKEYPRFPYEQMYDKKGDCEDTAILLIAILRQLGYNTVMIEFSDHVMVGVAMKNEKVLKALEKRYRYVVNYYRLDGKKYHVIETTAIAPIGYLPSEYWGVSARLHSFKAFK